jgi:hypothetical protein
MDIHGVRVYWDISRYDNRIQTWALCQARAETHRNTSGSTVLTNDMFDGSLQVTVQKKWSLAAVSSVKE